MIELIFSHLIAALGGAVIMAQLLAMGRRPLPPRQPLEDPTWPVDGPALKLARLNRALHHAVACDGLLRSLIESNGSDGTILNVSSGLVNLIKGRRNALQQQQQQQLKP